VAVWVWVGVVVMPMLIHLLLVLILLITAAVLISPLRRGPGPQLSLHCSFLEYKSLHTNELR
jgi:hypothetical protein